MKNLITSKFTEADKKELVDAIKNIESIIKSKVTALNEEDRQKYGSINEINKLFVNKVHDFHSENPDLSAPDIDWEDFEKDFETRLFLEKQIQSLGNIVYQLESTKTLHDYDNYQDALVDYGYTQYKKNAKESGFTKKAAELKQFFGKSSKEIKRAS
ncbi:hypothetical protein OOZ15_17925 [Galbibacter sp. EGI 63066]|uniref:hypothetical protein n=1 Tax=Galbibacter sp. EGI 63066 TaxID=2993559 RepID=UPI0022494726|nr:hypothetical protein [Galbibacter sp. EGI 63066]MCX2681838.1 hypothetical protein [Galbibacter sp. EGI 63066]